MKAIEILLIIFLFIFLIDLSFIEYQATSWKEYSIVFKSSGGGLIICFVIITWDLIRKELK